MHGSRVGSFKLWSLLGSFWHEAITSSCMPVYSAFFLLYGVHRGLRDETACKLVCSGCSTVCQGLQLSVCFMHWLKLEQRRSFQGFDGEELLFWFRCLVYVIFWWVWDVESVRSRALRLQAVIASA